MNLDELAKAIIGAEENAPQLGDILQPGKSVLLRVAGVQGLQGDHGDKGDPGRDGMDSTIPGPRERPGGMARIRLFPVLKGHRVRPEPTQPFPGRRVTRARKVTKGTAARKARKAISVGAADGTP